MESTALLNPVKSGLSVRKSAGLLLLDEENLLEKKEVLERRPGRPLIVKAFDAEQLHVRKFDLLRQRLAPVVTVVRQLGLDHAQALKLFGEMLDDEMLDDTRGREEGSS